MGKSGEPTGPARRGCRDRLGDPGPGCSPSPSPAELDPQGAGRPPLHGDKAPAALRDPRRGMEKRAGRSAGTRSAGSYLRSQEAGVAFGPSREREGKRDRGRVPRPRAKDCVREGF